MCNKTPIHAKYRIAELLRKDFGELNIKKGVTELAKHCKLRNERTVSEWMKAEAGSTFQISSLVIDRVLSFFTLQKESQLFTAEHKKMLKQVDDRNTLQHTEN